MRLLFKLHPIRKALALALSLISVSSTLTSCRLQTNNQEKLEALKSGQTYNEDGIVYPEFSPSISIESSAVYTQTSVVTLTLSAQSATEMYLTHTEGCVSGGDWETYATSKSWTLGQTNTTATVYVKFRDKIQNESACVSDTIIHDAVAPTLSISSRPHRSPTHAQIHLRSLTPERIRSRLLQATLL